MLSWSKRDKDTEFEECGVDGCDDPGVARVLVELGSSDAYAFGHGFLRQVKVLVCGRHLKACVHDKAEADAQRWLDGKYGPDWDVNDDDLGIEEYDRRWEEAYSAIGYVPDDSLDWCDEGEPDPPAPDLGELQERTLTLSRGAWEQMVDHLHWLVPETGAKDTTERVNAALAAGDAGPLTLTVALVQGRWGWDFVRTMSINRDVCRNDEVWNAWTELVQAIGGESQ